MPQPTFPDDLTPFQMLKMQNTQLARRHKSDSHLTPPSCPWTCPTPAAWKEGDHQKYDNGHKKGVLLNIFPLLTSVSISFSMFDDVIKHTTQRARTLFSSSMSRTSLFESAKLENTQFGIKLKCIDLILPQFLSETLTPRTRWQQCWCWVTSSGWLCGCLWNPDLVDLYSFCYNQGCCQKLT